MTTSQPESSPVTANWALPPGTATPDILQSQVEIYQQSILLRVFQPDGAIVRMMSADSIAHTLNSEISVSSGILPNNALWWQSTALDNQVALWREPAVWRVALQTKPLQPPQRLALPMPGLVFVCSPSKPPFLYAAKRRPASPDDLLYRAPTFNVFGTGRACPGNHVFPHRAAEIPESFFASFFSMAGDHRRRSAKHADSLMDLWNEIDGTSEYPMDDLVPDDTVEEIMKRTSER